MVQEDKNRCFQVRTMDTINRKCVICETRHNLLMLMIIITSQGSILVDYFVELSEIGKKVNTQEIKSIFHDSLNAYASNNGNSSESDNLLVLGAFTIDPASTDFVGKMNKVKQTLNPIKRKGIN